ncbi:MAG: hypothetical protein M3367_16220 [Acidobacteriota bacterium]|nr:hypothetical protein [Acidobacteriota bacterium]
MRIMILILLFASFCFAQNQIATTESGKKVVLKADGTWEYEKPKEKVSETTGNCSEYIGNFTDRMTGSSAITGKSRIVISSDGGKTGIALTTMLLGEIIALNVTTVSGGCIDENTRVLILFEDGTKLNLKSSNKFNCKGDVTLFFGGQLGNTDALETIITKKVKAMRVNTLNSFVEQDFSESDAKKLMNTFICLKQASKNEKSK